MRYLIIGDIHGRDNWREANIRKADKVIFLGDYVDSPTPSDLTILENLKSIVQLKKRNPDKVILLLGNHDVQYLHYPRHQISDFRSSMQPALTRLFSTNRALFQMAYQHGNHLFTHAGVTNSWYNEFLRLPMLEQLREPGDNLADLVNKVETTTDRYLLYATSIYRGGYGNGSFLWADIKETATDMLHGYHQVVGHSKVKEAMTISFAGRSTIYIDVLWNQTYFHELEL